MRIRPIEPGDKPLIAGAFAALSEESRYRRFFTPLRELEPDSSSTSRRWTTTTTRP